MWRGGGASFSRTTRLRKAGTLEVFKQQRSINRHEQLGNKLKKTGDSGEYIMLFMYVDHVSEQARPGSTRT